MNTQIYIADLAAYNAGRLRGRWIDANQTPDELSDEVKNMLLESPESNIPCTVCNDCGHIEHYATLSLKAGVSLSVVNSWTNDNADSCDSCGSLELRQTITAEEFAIHDSDGIEVEEYTSLEMVSELAEQLSGHGDAYLAYIELVGSHYATADGFNDQYMGEADSEEAFAEQYADDCGMETSNYFNWDQFTYELFMDYSFINGFVFSS